MGKGKDVNKQNFCTWKCKIMTPIHCNKLCTYAVIRGATK